MNKKTIKMISKLALFFVVFGFFQPVACSQNGFELAKVFIDYENAKCIIAAIGLYLLFFSAVFSILYTLYLLIKKDDINSQKTLKIDFLLLLISIVGGLTTFFFLIDEFDIDVLERGSYFILIGWIISAIFLLLSREKKE